MKVITSLNIWDLDICHPIRELYRVWNYKFTTPEKNILFLGKTGYGKSSTINTLLNKELMKTDDICSCTAEVNAIKFHDKQTKANIDTNNAKYKQYDLDINLNYIDFPGIGESMELDKKYIEMYDKYLENAAVIIYFLRIDQRDFSLDEPILKKIIGSFNEKRLIIVLNMIDKIPGYNPDFVINNKIKEIRRLFDFCGSIVPISTKEKSGIKRLEDEIFTKISNFILPTFWDIFK